jgi:Uma2 family endonuclease
MLMTVATDERRSQTPSTVLASKPDRLMTLQGGWEHFKLIQQGCEQNPGVRLSYFDRTIELFMPGFLHETFSHTIGTLLTIFLAQQGIMFFATGSMDQEQENVVSLRPDQSYCIGTSKKIPDLSIEVVVTSGSIHKLSKYRAIGSLEVWFWEDGTLRLYRLRGEDYEAIDRSELEALQDLDLEMFKRHVMMAETDLGEAVRSFTKYMNPVGRC